MIAGIYLGYTMGGDFAVTHTKWYILLYTKYHLHTVYFYSVPYRGKLWPGGNVAHFVNHPWFAKLKPSKLVFIINNLLADLLIHQIFFCQMLETSQFTKLSLHTVYANA